MFDISEDVRTLTVEWDAQGVRYKEFEKDLRSGHDTPMMDARQSRRNDPWGTDVSSYRNWPSPTARAMNRRVYDE